MPTQDKIFVKSFLCQDYLVTIEQALPNFGQKHMCEMSLGIYLLLMQIVIALEQQKSEDRILHIEREKFSSIEFFN